MFLFPLSPSASYWLFTAGIFVGNDLKMLSGNILMPICTSMRHTASSEPSCTFERRAVRPIRECEKNILKKRRISYTSYTCGGAPIKPMKVCALVKVASVIIYANFCIFTLKSLVSTEDWIQAFPTGPYYGHNNTAKHLPYGMWSCSFDVYIQSWYHARYLMDNSYSMIPVILTSGANFITRDQRSIATLKSTDMFTDDSQWQLINHKLNIQVTSKFIWQGRQLLYRMVALV